MTDNTQQILEEMTIEEMRLRAKEIANKVVVKRGMIYAQIAKIMQAVEPIAKSRKNSQGYNFRGIDDLYIALQTVLANHGVFTVPYVVSDRSEERQTKNGGLLIYRILTIDFIFYAEDGSSVTARTVGEAMDSSDKATNKAMSVAHKYALLQVFCIPTEEPKDPENDHHEALPKESKTDRPAPQQSQQRPTNAQPPVAPKTSAAPPQPPKGFNVNLKEHKQLLFGILDKKGVASNHWDDVAAGMHGRPMTHGEVDKVLKDYMERIVNE